MSRFKIYTFTLFLLSFNFCDAQSAAKTYDVVLEIKNFTSQKTLPLIVSYCSTLEGCKLNAYCEKQGWVVFEMEENYFPTSADPNQLFKNAPFEWIYKVGTTKSQLEKACKQPLIPFGKGERIND